MRSDPPLRDRLRREALCLFVDRGVDAVSVRDIAGAAGCTPSSLYTHWPSLAALIEELFREGYAAYARALLTEVDAAPGAPFPTRLAAMVRRICALQAEDPALFAFLLLAQHRQAGLPRQSAEPEASPVAVLHGAVLRAREAGELAVDEDPGLLTAALVGIIVQAATFLHYGRIARGLDAMADEIVALALRLIGAGPEHPPRPSIGAVPETSPCPSIRARPEASPEPRP
jgi:AcrR family transcriptional regulator